MYGTTDGRNNNSMLFLSCMLSVWFLYSVFVTYMEIHVNINITLYIDVYCTLSGVM